MVITIDVTTCANILKWNQNISSLHTFSYFLRRAADSTSFELLSFLEVFRLITTHTERHINKSIHNINYLK